jgi:hypothetical protein
MSRQLAVHLKSKGNRLPGRRCIVVQHNLLSVREPLDRNEKNATRPFEQSHFFGPDMRILVLRDKIKAPLFEILPMSPAAFVS